MNKKIDRNYLEIYSISELVESANPSEEFIIELVDPPDFQLNKFFYKNVGKKHYWVDRLAWTENQWNKYIFDANTGQTLGAASTTPRPLKPATINREIICLMG